MQSLLLLQLLQQRDSWRQQLQSWPCQQGRQPWGQPWSYQGLPGAWLLVHWPCCAVMLALLSWERRQAWAEAQLPGEQAYSQSCS